MCFVNRIGKTRMEKHTRECRTQYFCGIVWLLTTFTIYLFTKLKQNDCFYPSNGRFPILKENTHATYGEVLERNHDACNCEACELNSVWWVNALRWMWSQMRFSFRMLRFRHDTARSNCILRASENWNFDVQPSNQKWFHRSESLGERQTED